MNSLQWLHAESESDFILTQMLETREVSSIRFQSELVWMEARFEKSLIEGAARQPTTLSGNLCARREARRVCASKLNYGGFN